MMHRDNLKNSLETRWDIALLVIGLFLYAGLLGRTIYLNYEPRLWSDLWLRAAWTLDGGSWALQIFFVWMMFNACFFFLSSVIVFCIRAKSLAAPDTSHLKLALIVTFLVIAALTGWFLLQVAFDSETGEFESPNIGPGLVATGAIYVASLLGLRGMLPAIFAVFGTGLTLFRRVFVVAVTLSLFSGLYWSLLGSITTLLLYASYYQSLGP